MFPPLEVNITKMVHHTTENIKRNITVINFLLKFFKSSVDIRPMTKLNLSFVFPTKNYYLNCLVSLNQSQGEKNKKTTLKENCLR